MLRVLLFAMNTFEIIYVLKYVLCLPANENSCTAGGLLQMERKLGEFILHSDDVQFAHPCLDRLAGLVVKASASRVEDPGFDSGLSHTSDSK